MILLEAEPGARVEEQDVAALGGGLPVGEVGRVDVVHLLRPAHRARRVLLEEARRPVQLEHERLLHHQGERRQLELQLLEVVHAAHAVEAQEELDHRVEVNQIAQDHLNQDLEDVAGEMSKIKAILKGKFGEQVVLDDESDDASDSPHENSSDPQPETG